jgi:hypothetical protein
MGYLSEVMSPSGRGVWIEYQHIFKTIQPVHQTNHITFDITNKFPTTLKTQHQPSSAMSSSLSLKRSNSSSSAQSEASNNQVIPLSRNNTNESGIKRRSSDNKGQGTFMQCGRHSNQWLFNDMSLMDMAKSVFGKKD